VSETVFDSLVHLDKYRNVIPAIAKSWTIAPGWKYIDFYLRDDVKFHNGDPVTSEDIKFSLETYMRPELRFLFRPNWRDVISKIELVSPKQVRLYLSTADWSFLQRLWWGGGIMPKGYREKVGDEAFANKPIGAGPFKWTDYKQDQWIQLESLEKHYRMPPTFKMLKILYVPDHSTRFAMLKSGEVDIAALIGPHVAQVSSDPNLRVFLVKYVSSSTIVYADLTNKENKSPFHDIRVRRAVSLAIDRKSICEKILQGNSEPYGDVINPLCLGYDKSLKPDPYDPKKARAMLADAGYPNGFSTTLHVMRNNYSAEALAANLEDVGIKTKIEVYEGGTFYTKFFQKKFDGLVPWSGWFGADKAAASDLNDTYLKGMPYTYYITDEIDKALRDAMWVETEKEMTLWGKKISQLIRESHITTFLWANHEAFGLSSKIKSWEPTIGGTPACEYATIKLNR
jgi:peptide/nickel transport system substrate-binding protein